MAILLLPGIKESRLVNWKLIILLRIFVWINKMKCYWVLILLDLGRIGFTDRLILVNEVKLAKFKLDLNYFLSKV